DARSGALGARPSSRGGGGARRPGAADRQLRMEPPMNRYSHPDTAALVLAAGMGKRMNSDLAKVLHPMAGHPLLWHVLATLDDLGVARKVVVIGHQRDRVRAAFADRADVEW